MISREQVRDEWLMAQASTRTRETYAYPIRAWFAFLDERGTAWDQARRADVDAWRVSLARRLAPSTLRLYLATVSSFYRHTLLEYDPAPVQANPVDRVRRPKLEQVSHADGLTAAEARALLAAAEAHGPRMHALTYLMLGTAARVSEIVGAREQDLGWADGVRALMVTRKGGIVQPIKLTAEVWDALDEYLSSRLPVSDGWLIATTGGRRMTRQWAYQLVRNLAARTVGREGLVIGPHDLRATAITLALDAGMTLTEARQFAGHANAATTERYDIAAHTRGGRAAAAVGDVLRGGSDAA
jgi:integrase/recombinase XerD